MVHSFRKSSVVMVVVGMVGCGSSGDNGNKVSVGGGNGICVSNCPKACLGDGNCDTSAGQVCCNYGSAGKTCTSAASCPLVCASDKTCSTQSGQACIRPTLAAPEKICSEPTDGLTLCQGNAQCNGATGEICCPAYKEPVCLQAAKCPQACSSASGCNLQAGDVCCTTLAQIDSALKSGGYCANPSMYACPKACTQSSECTGTGELCCAGICQRNCPKSCNVSSDCPQQICCTNPVIESPYWNSSIPKPGYTLTSPTATSTFTGTSTNTGTSCGTNTNTGTSGGTNTDIGA